MKTPLLLAACLFFSAAAHAEDKAAPVAPAKSWKESAEISFVTANGNTKAQTSSGKNAFRYDFDPRLALEHEVGGLGAKSDGKVTAEQYYSWEKLAYKVDSRNFVFERYRWDRNRFADIAHRHDFSVGGGRELWKTATDLWTAEGGPGYVNEQHFVDKRKKFAAARGYTKYGHDFSPSIKLSQDFEYVQSLADSRDSRLNTETAFSAAVNTIVSVKNSFIWRHDSRPAAGVRKDDTIFSVALLATY